MDLTHSHAQNLIALLPVPFSIKIHTSVHGPMRIHIRTSNCPSWTIIRRSTACRLCIHTVCIIIAHFFLKLVTIFRLKRGV